MSRRATQRKAPGTCDYQAKLKGYYCGMKQGVCAVPQSSAMEQFIDELRELVQETVGDSERRVA